jgi:NADH-quinone oxidoreductase subunit M
MPETTVSVAGLEVSTPALAFFLVCAGLALRAPVWPVHGWFSRLADEAPASVFVAVSAATVPVAVMTFCRVSNVLFPSVMDAGSGWILGAGMLNLFVGSVSIIAQRRLAGMVAYLCVVQLGLCLVGLGSQDASAMAGVIFHQLGGGLALAAIGLLMGGLATRAGVLELSPSSGGLARTAPAAAAVMGLAIGAFVGVPGMSGFVGQSLIAMGGYSRNALVLLAVGASSLLVAYSLFGAFRRLFLGEPEAAQAKGAGELTNSERIFLIPLVGLIVLLGFFPKPFLDWVRPTAAALVARTTEAPAPAAEAAPVESQPTPAAPSEQGP